MNHNTVDKDCVWGKPLPIIPVRVIVMFAYNEMMSWCRDSRGNCPYSSSTSNCLGIFYVHHQKQVGLRTSLLPLSGVKINSHVPGLHYLVQISDGVSLHTPTQSWTTAKSKCIITYNIINYFYRGSFSYFAICTMIMCWHVHFTYCKRWQKLALSCVLSSACRRPLTLLPCFGIAQR